MTWEILFVLAIFIFSALAGWIYLPQIILIAKKRKLFDEVDGRKSHTGAIPRIGGLSFFPIFLLSISLFCCIRYALDYPIANISETIVFLDLLCLISGLTLMYIVGLADDLTGVTYKVKFIIQIIASSFVIVGGFWINNLQGIFGIHEIPWFIGMPLTILIAVFVMNAYNLIDGIDGLCSGLSSFALVFLGIWFTYNNLLLYGMMSFAILGVLSVFFFMNVYGTKNKVFMGDTGSLTLGFIIIFLGFKFYWFSVNTEFPLSFPNPIAAILGITFVPLFDTVRVFAYRISKGLSPFYPDRNHIHHKFLLLGFGHRSSAMCIVLLQAIFCVVNTVLQPLNINLIIIIDLVVAIEVCMVVAAALFLKRAADTNEIKSWDNYQPDEESDKNNIRYKEIPKHTKVYEICGPMFFGMTDKFMNLVIDKDTKVVIIRMRSVPSLDASALESLYVILEKCKKQGVTVIFSHVNEQPLKLMKKAKFDIDAGRDNFCANIDEALKKAESIVSA